MDSMKDGEIYWVATNGIGKTMPAAKDKLSDTERWQVVNYVRSLRAAQKAKAPGEHH
jgi:mono/diheme cytochrome c family protein